MGSVGGGGDDLAAGGVPRLLEQALVADTLLGGGPEGLLERPACPFEQLLGLVSQGFGARDPGVGVLWADSARDNVVRADARSIWAVL